MKLLAWDTSSKAGAIAALELDVLDVRGQPEHRYEMSLDVNSQHSERLLWGIDQVLGALGWKIHDVDFFAVGVGPGSFTGLRIGMTTARTLAHALGKPLIGVSSLEALALPALEAHPEAFVIAATDACKGELFVRWQSRNLLPVNSANYNEEVCEPAALIEKLKKAIGQSSWIVVGEGRLRYEDDWKKLPSATRLKTDCPDRVQPRALGQLAAEAWRKGQSRPALEVHPRYLRASDAELKLKAGLL